MAGSLEIVKSLSLSRRTDRRTSEKGFTLIEVMVVLGIIAAVTMMIVPRIGNQNNQIKAAVRHIGSLSREALNHSKLFGATHRLVIDLGEGYDSKSDQSYWVEISTSPYLLPSDKETLFDKRKRDDDEKEGKKSPFDMAVRLTKEKKTLPGDLRFKSVELTGIERPLENGLAYVHFFPQGRAEEAIIQLGVDDKLSWSLLIHPLTGKVDIVAKPVRLRDIKQGGR